jgi:hypothetical protein
MAKTGFSSDRDARDSDRYLALRGAIFESTQLSYGFVFTDTVRFLDLADELIALTGDLVQVVIGKLAPLFFDFSFVLLPVTCNRIPVHNNLL